MAGLWRAVDTPSSHSSIGTPASSAPAALESDTIFALSSAPGRAGVAVFRLSGPGAGAALQALTRRAPPLPRRAALRRLLDAGGQPIDAALVLHMPGPGTFTGEDVVEIMPHGSPAVVEALAARLLQLGLRQAEPGEFTRRAFGNGRLDLLEAEGLADLIDADTEAQRLQALRQMEGGLSARAQGWKEAILDALAPIEGEIDFPDEGDVPDRLSRQAGPGLDALARELEAALAGFGRGERVREGLRIAVVGAPNAGKSSFINWLAGRDAAIVSDIPGTTRDVVEVQLEVANLPVRVSDTAGLRETKDAVEAEGVRRAGLAARGADIRILVVDASAPDPSVPEALVEGDLVLLNKADLQEGNVSRETSALMSALLHALPTPHVLSVSVRTGYGLDAVLDWLEREVAARFAPTRSAGLTRARHRDLVGRALGSVRDARARLDAAPELAGEALRAALQALEELAGRADMEAVLDRVFGRFCIGK